MSRDWQKDMTREEILAMKPGQIDRHIHEMLFEGEDLSEFEYKGNGSYVKVTETSVIWRDVPNYSTDISEAWKIAEQYPIATVERVEIFEGNIEVKATLWEGFDYRDPIEATAKTAPEAICKAALLAVLEGINLPGEETTP